MKFILQGLCPGFRFANYRTMNFESTQLVVSCISQKRDQTGKVVTWGFIQIDGAWLQTEAAVKS
jgi:hypothetical protein